MDLPLPSTSLPLLNIPVTLEKGCAAADRQDYNLTYINLFFDGVN